MPNAELLLKEAEGLPPEYFTVVLNLIRSLKQAAVVSYAAVPSPEKADLEDNGIGIPAWKFFGRSSPPTREESLAAIERGFGIAQGVLSSDEFLEMRRKDKELEDARFRHTFHKDGTEA